MKTDAKYLMEITIKACHFEEIADLFALTEQQKLDPRAAEWIIDRIKQFQTSYMIRKAIVEKVDLKEAPFKPEQPIDKSDIK